MKRTVLIVVAMAALSGLLVFARTYHSRVKPLRTGYTMKMTVVEDGRLISNVRRQVKSDGDFMEETDHLNPDGSIAKQTRTVGAASQGALMIDDANKRLTFFGGAAVIHGVTEAELKAQKDYAREDSLLGYRVIVQRSCETSGTCTEYWIAPDLGSDDVKVDLVNGDHRATKQAASITLGEPSFEIPDYPRDVSPRLANPAKP